MSLFKGVSREFWGEIDSSYDGMMWVDLGFGSGIIVDRRPEGVYIFLEFVYLVSM